jgi:peptidoglycan L-alanyl-D-glutamate endopeptidase CwlK
MNQDKTTLKRITTAHPFLREALLCIYLECIALLTNPHVMLRFSCVLRAPEEQDELYNQGRYDNPGRIVTWVKKWFSFHQYGLAVDIVLLIDKDGNGSFEAASWDVAKDWDGDGVPDWLEVVEIFRKYGWEWGIITRSGKHIDKPHFQRTFGYTAAQLKKLPRDKEGYPVLFSKVA